MKATIIQTDLRWEDKNTNLLHISSMLDKAEPAGGIVILPEMFTTGFSMKADTLAEQMNGTAVSWMRTKASSGGYALCGSLIIEDGGKYYNRMVFVTPDGEITFYDKRHPHSMSGEHTIYSKGNKRVIAHYLDLNFNLLVCYDLRFPVWSRNRGDADVIIYSANWPSVRSNVWKSLLVARAIENQCYVIGVNRVGKSYDGTSYEGDSVIIGPEGEIIASMGTGTEGIASAMLSKEKLEKYRSHMPVWKDADSFTLL